MDTDDLYGMPWGSNILTAIAGADNKIIFELCMLCDNKKADCRSKMIGTETMRAEVYDRPISSCRKFTTRYKTRTNLKQAAIEIVNAADKKEPLKYYIF